MKARTFATLKSDLPASIVVFLVAVPLCLGIALASGAPLFAGIIAGIIGGIVVGAASGSPLGVSGPAAGLAVIVLNTIATLGSWETFLLAVVVAGVIQVVLGFARAGVIGYYFPSSVIKGMLTGIGLTIILKQIPHAVGYDADLEGSLAFIGAGGENTLSTLGHMFAAVQPGALVVALLSIAVLLLWERPVVKRFKASLWIQGPLVAVAMGIALNALFTRAFPGLAIEPSHLVQLPVAQGFAGLASLITMPDFSQVTNMAVYTTAVTLAIVASLETLLCVEATDRLDPQKRVTPTDRELKAQGLGNIVSGLIGGLPITQVIVRSSANIQSGGRTKLSAILHGALLLVAVVALPTLLNLIPLATLAAVLLTVGYKLAKPALLAQMYKLGWAQFVPFTVTVVGILATDLLVGIGLGMTVAVFLILMTNYRNPYFLDMKAHRPGDVVRLALSEDVSFLNRAAILRTLNAIPDGTKVEIDARRTVHIDYDVFEILKDFEQTAPLRGIEVTLKGLHEPKRKNDALREVGRVIRREQKRVARRAVLAESVTQ
ncbi:MAG: SulP family inorganic anion transporter [Acidobacteria bacterium]|nr:SulP family inorganic anion transporter [Acidobacteriota bacterium]